MKGEFTQLEKQLETYAAGVLAWSVTGPKQAELAGAQSHYEKCVQVRDAWLTRRAEVERDRIAADERSRAEIAALADQYLASRGPGLWARLRAGVKGMGGRSAIPATFEQVFAKVARAVEQAVQAVHDAHEALVVARQGAADERRMRLARALTTMFQAGVGPLIEAQSVLGRPYADLPAGLGPKLARLGVDSDYAMTHGERQGLVAAMAQAEGVN